jgi:hypothetical protein
VAVFGEARQLFLEPLGDDRVDRVVDRDDAEHLAVSSVEHGQASRS